jgi:hypothetical protein
VASIRPITKSPQNDTAPERDGPLTEALRSAQAPETGDTGQHPTQPGAFRHGAAGFPGRGRDRAAIGCVGG